MGTMVGRGAVLAGCAAVGLVWGPAAPAHAQPRPKTVTVDCAAGGSINAALRRTAPVLVVEIRGVCVEDVVITRDNVTLRGADPAVDGIRAISGAAGNPTVAVEAPAHTVSLENLTIGEGNDGVRVRNARDVFVKGCRLEKNTAWGAAVWFGAASFSDTTATLNHTGGIFAAGSDVVCHSCAIVDNVGPTGLSGGAVYAASSRVSLTGTLLRGSNHGLDLDPGSEVQASGTTIGGAITAIRQVRSRTGLLEGKLEGRLEVDGGELVLFGVQQTSNPLFNRVRNSGFVRLEPAGTGAATELLGTTRFETFSRGVALGASLDVLQCSSGADVFCDAATTRTSSTCGLCP